MSIRDAGTTIRQSSTALLTIDSEDRFRNWEQKRNALPGSFNSNPYNFSLIREAALVNGYMTRVALTEITFPWTIPNINVKTNLMNMVVSDGPITENYVLSIPVGFYTPLQLALAILSEVNAVRPGTLIQFQYGVYKVPCFSYQPAEGIQVAFFPMVINQSQPLPDGSVVNIYPYSSTTKQLFDVLGFTSANSEFSNSITLGQTSFAQAIRYIDIVSPQLTANQGLIDSTSQSVGHTALCRLYITDDKNNFAFTEPGFSPVGCEPFVIYRQFQNPKQVAWNAIMPISGSIQFQVYDDNGELLVPDESLEILTGGGTIFKDLQAYADWSLTLQLSEN